MAYGLHSKKFDTRTYWSMYVVSQIVIAPNRFCVVSIFRQCHGTHLYVHGPRNQFPYFALTFQDLVHEWFFALFKSMDVTTNSAIVGIKFLYRIILLSSGFSLIFLQRKCRFRLKPFLHL